LFESPLEYNPTTVLYNQTYSIISFILCYIQHIFNPDLNCPICGKFREVTLATFYRWVRKMSGDIFSNFFGYISSPDTFIAYNCHHNYLHVAEYNYSWNENSFA